MLEKKKAQTSVGANDIAPVEQPLEREEKPINSVAV